MRFNAGIASEWIPVQRFDPHKMAMVEAPVRLIPANDDYVIGFDRQGQPRLLAAKCPHRRLPLVKYATFGDEPGTIRCTAHGYTFDVQSGECLRANQCDEPQRLPCAQLVQQEDGTWVANLPDKE